MANILFRGWEALERAPAVVAERHRIELSDARVYIENGIKEGKVGARRFSAGRVEPFEAATLATAQIDFMLGTIAEVLPVVFFENAPLPSLTASIRSTAEKGIAAEVNIIEIDAYIETLTRVPDTARPNTKNASGKGGRPAAFRWDEILVEACRWIHWKGVPTPRTPLTRHLMAFCAERYDAPPDDRTLTRRVSALLEDLARPYDD